MTMADVGFIMKLTIDDARNGHITEDLLLQPNQDDYRKMLINLTNGIPSYILSNGKAELRQSAIYVLRHKLKGNAGFIHVSEWREGSDNDELEALAVSVKKEFRRSGCAKLMVNYLINEAPETSRIYARCLIKSTAMCNLLLSIGFSVLSESQFGTKTFWFKNTDKHSQTISNIETTKAPEMNSDFLESAFNRISPDTIYTIGQCMYWPAHIMMISGVTGMIIRNVAHTPLETLGFPTFWIPESFAGAFLTAMLYFFGFGICWFIKGIDRKLR